MTTVPNIIARLEFIDPRIAWSHEAHQFTPWLCANLDQLSEAVGMQLEPQDSEVSVEEFAADILARNAMDDSLVLIENQLEGSDHGHLGQIMTYVAGLNARSVIWIAKQFREPHLAAIKWLNDNTVEGLAFFAVQLKVARIAGSPPAPLFDVLERPNNWERRLHAAASNATGEPTEIGRSRRAFWEDFVARHPEEASRPSGPTALTYRWIPLPDLNVIITLYIYTEGGGLSIRAPRGQTIAGLRELLQPHAAALETKLGVPIGDRDQYCFSDSTKANREIPQERTALIDWLVRRSHEYERALRECLTPRQPQVSV